MSDESVRPGGHPTGDLAAFALGALEPDEARATETHVSRCEQCSAELAAHREVLFAVAALGVAPEPPADLRARIVDRHRAGSSQARFARRGPSRWAPARPRYGSLTAFLTRPVPLAVSLALVVLLVASFLAVGQARRDADAYASALAGVADGRVVALAPDQAIPSARGALVIPSEGQPYLVLRLPEPPAGKTWEAWVLRGQTAIPAGTSDGNGVFTLVLTAPFSPGDGAAVSLENRPGVQKPTTVVLAVGRT